LRLWSIAVIDPLSETAAEAIVVLDAQFPWLCATEKRRAPKRLSTLTR
jgi:hypothetical protein